MTGIFLAFVLLSISVLSSCMQGQLLRRADPGNCTRFVVSGPIPGYFQNHVFYDFRQLGEYFNGETPPAITSKEDTGTENVTSTYFNSTAFQGWDIMSGVRDPDSTVPMIYSAQNLFISNDTDSSDGGGATFLTLRTTRRAKFQSMVEIRNTADFLHASLRIRMKILASSDQDVAPGAVVGFFTYESDNQESDIEVLTVGDADTVHLTNQPASDTDLGAHANVSLPNGKHWTDWTDYRLDWFNGTSVWYIDAESEFQSTDSVPTVPSSVMLNLWSNGQSFSGTMAIGKEVLVAVQWIEMVYNVSDAHSSASKQSSERSPITCTVDGVSVTGDAEVVAESKGVRSRAETTTSVLGVFFVALSLVRSWDLI